MAAHNLPTLVTSRAPVPKSNTSGRDLTRLQRVVDRDVTLVQGKARVVAERGRAGIQALESVALEALRAGSQLSRQATLLSNTSPGAAPLLQAILAESGIGLTQIVSDTAQDVR